MRQHPAARINAAAVDTKIAALAAIRQALQNRICGASSTAVILREGGESSISETLSIPCAAAAYRIARSSAQVRKRRAMTPSLWCRACHLGPVARMERSRVEERRGSLGHAATLRFLSPLISRVEDWRAGLGRSLVSLLSRPFVCECPTISTMPRLQPPPRRTQRADFPHCAPPFASRQRLWDLSCWGDFRPVASHSIGVEQP